MDNANEQAHFARLASNFLGFRRSAFLHDTILCVGDREFRVHGLLLASASKFFESILKDYDKPEMRYIRLPRLDPNVMAVLLDYIYTGRLILPFNEGRQEFEMPPNLIETFTEFGINLLERNGEIITYKREEDFSVPAANVKVECDPFVIKPELLQETQFLLNELPVEQENLPEDFMNTSLPPFHIKSERRLINDMATELADFEDADARQMNSFDKDLSYLCMYCGDQFPGEPELIYHMKETHVEQANDPSGLPTCATCERSFRSLQELSEHDCVKVKKNSYFCGECQKGFPFPSQLSTHLKSHSGERPYQCPKCPKRFSASLNLKQHLRTHTGERPYTCEVCAKKFTQRSHLQTHLRTHTGEKPFICEICTKAYKNRLDLRLHCEKKHNLNIRLRESNHPNSFHR